MALTDIFKSGVKDAVAGVLDGASSIISKFKADPTKVVEIEADLEKLRADTNVKLAQIDLEAAKIDAQELETVNQTMREEGKSEHWAQWLWRPMIGFTFCGMLINNFIIMPYLKKYGIEKIELPSDVFTAILVILGAASVGRGVKQYQEAKKA